MFHHHSHNGSTGSGGRSSNRLSGGSGGGSGSGSGQQLSLAQQYDHDKDRIIKSCFSKTDDTGALFESYITHVRITEDAHYPSSRPSPNSAESSKKQRVIIVAVRKSGRVRVHKARENPNGVFQIGKTWNLDELSKVEYDPLVPSGFLMFFGKPYYWTTSTATERHVFVSSVVRIYRKYTGGKVPDLVGVEGLAEPSPSSSPKPLSSTPTTRTVSGQHPSTGYTPPPVANPAPRSRNSSNSGPSAAGVAGAAGAAGAMGLAAGATVAGSGSQPPYGPVGPSGYPSVPNRSSISSGPTHRSSEVSKAGLRGSTQGHPPQGPQGPQGHVTPHSISNAPSNKLGPSAFPSHGGHPATGYRHQGSVGAAPVASRGSLSNEVPRHKSAPMISGPTSIPQDSTLMYPSRNAPPKPGHVGSGATAGIVAGAVAGTAVGAVGAVAAAGKSGINSSTTVNKSSSDTISSGQSETTIAKASDLKAPAPSLTVIAPSPTTETMNISSKPIPPVPAPFSQPPAPTVTSEVENGSEPLRKLNSASSSMAMSISTAQSIRLVADEPKESKEVLIQREDTASVKSIKIFARPEHQNVESNNENETRRYPDEDSNADVVDDEILKAAIAAEAIEIESSDEEINKEEQNELASVLPELSGSNNRQSFVERARRRRSFSTSSNVSVVEETLNEFNWTGRDDARNLESNIIKELLNIEALTLHNVVDLDDRLDDLDSSLEEAIKDCQRLDSVLAYFSVQLGSFSDDISHIESQGQGLQVQTTNQKILWNELHGVLQTISLSEDVLQKLKIGGLDSIQEINQAELALVELYKSVSAVRTTGSHDVESLGSMRALKEKRHLFERAASEFSSRFKLILDNRLKQAVKNVEAQAFPVNKQTTAPQLKSLDQSFISTVFPLSGIVLFVREIDHVTYSSALNSYETLIKPFYDTGLANFLSKWQRAISPSLAGSGEQRLLFSPDGFGGTDNTTGAIKSLKRSQTLARLKTHTDTGNGSLARDRQESVVTLGGLSENSVDSLSNYNWGQIEKSLEQILNSIRGVIIAQQEIYIELFRMSSFADSNFPQYVSTVPISKRRYGTNLIRIREIDSDRGKAQELLEAMTMVFATLQEDIVKFANTIASGSCLEIPGMIVLLEMEMSKLETTNQDFWIQLLHRVRDKMLGVWDKYIDQQIQSISNTLVSNKKRNGVVSFVRVFPWFTKRLEDQLNKSTSSLAVEDLPVAQMVEDSLDRISKAIFQNLQRLAKESTGPSNSGTQADYEDKELLNYHVMMIENMHVLMEEVYPNNSFESKVLDTIVSTAQQAYRTELSLYIDSVIRRPLGKLLEFVEGVESLLAKNPTENPAVRHGYSSSALRKLLSTYDLKEVKKGIETLHKRIEKHFSDEDKSGVRNGVLVDKVWKAVQAEYSGVYGRLRKILDNNYSDGEAITLEFTKADINASFSRYRQ